MWAGLRVHSASGIQEVAANKHFEILLANVSTLENKIPQEMVVSHATRSPATRLVATGTTTARICESLILMVYQSIAVPIWQTRTEVTDLNFVAPDLDITNYTLTNQNSLLSQLVRSKRDNNPRQQNLQVGTLENKTVSTQEWKSMVYLSLVKNKAL